MAVTKRDMKGNRALWRCVGGVVEGVRSLIELLHWEFRGDIGQLCIGNWISVLLQNTEQLMFYMLICLFLFRPLGPESLLLRGARLKNTKEIFGL